MAERSRASPSYGSTSSVPSNPEVTSPMPVRERIATPFHWPGPWCTESYPSDWKVSCGNESSASLVSCRHRTSGCAYWSHSSTRGSRAFSELTFQVAKRTAFWNLPDAVLEVVRVRDQEFHPHRLPDDGDHVVTAVVEGAVPDAGRHLRGQRGEVVVVAEERTQPGALGGGGLGAETELPFEHPQRIDRDAGVELHAPLDRRHHVVHEELADRLEELDGRRSILHDVSFPLAVAGATDELEEIPLHLGDPPAQRRQLDRADRALEVGECLDL